MKENYEIIENVPYIIAKDIIETYHYSKCMPPALFIYGLLNKKTNKIVGICIFGKSANYRNNNFFNFPMIELTRLVLIERDTTNLLSYFVSQCLKLLPLNGFIISYADSFYNHCGYIYQATNWIYTGKTVNIDAFINKNLNDNKIYHRRSLYSIYKTSDRKILENYDFKRIYVGYKHRYFYIKAKNKKEKKEMLNLLQKKYKILPYPKEQNVYYDNKVDKEKIYKILF